MFLGLGSMPGGRDLPTLSVSLVLMLLTVTQNSSGMSSPRWCRRWGPAAAAASAEAALTGGSGVPKPW